jgi:hypothetical protein
MTSQELVSDEPRGAVEPLLRCGTQHGEDPVTHHKRFFGEAVAQEFRVEAFYRLGVHAGPDRGTGL